MVTNVGWAPSKKGIYPVRSFEARRSANGAKYAVGVGHNRASIEADRAAYYGQTYGHSDICYFFA